MLPRDSTPPPSSRLEEKEQNEAERPAANTPHEQESSALKEPGPGHRTLLLVVLLSTALLLMLGPSTYCGFAEGQVEMAVKYRQAAHRQEEGGTCYVCQDADDGGNRHGALVSTKRKFLGDVVSSAMNGLLMMSAYVLSGVGTDLHGSRIFAMGVSTLFANAFSNGFSKFLMESSKEEFALNQLKLEYQEVRAIPDEEIGEMVCHYKKHGVSEEDANMVAKILSKYEDYWVQHMMREELGVDLPRGNDAAAATGFAVFVSFIGFGMVPLLGVAVPLILQKCTGSGQWYRPQFSTSVVLCICAFALVFLGMVLSWVNGSQNALSNSLVALTGGCIAAVCSFTLGQKCMHVVSMCGRADAFDATIPWVRSTSEESTVQKERGESHADHSERVVRRKSMSNETAWPHLQRKFLRGLVMLWIAISTFAVLSQFVARMGYQCLRVFAYGWLTCITTGIGPAPFLFVSADTVTETVLAIANTVASGMMLSASAGMLLESHEHCGPGDWQIIVGLLAGCVFIRVSQNMLGDEEEAGVEALHGAIVERRHLRKAMLIFTVMFCHSAAEGIAVGVAFDKQLHAHFGLYVSILLAVHNVPEGLAVALVLVPRGVSASLSCVIATLTSVPQPLLALTAFLFVDAFQCLLPLGLSFAAGAMVYVSLHELLLEAAEQLGKCRTFLIVAVSFAMMSFFNMVLHRTVEM